MTDSSIFEKMLDLSNDNALVRFTLGSAFLKQRQYKEAVQHLQIAIEFSPDYLAAWKALSKAFIGLKDLQKALDTLRKSKEIAILKGDQTSVKELSNSISEINKMQDYK